MTVQELIDALSQIDGGTELIVRVEDEGLGMFIPASFQIVLPDQDEDDDDDDKVRIDVF